MIQGTCNSVHCSWFLYLSTAYFTTGEHDYKIRVILYTVVDSLSLYSVLLNWRTWLSSDKVRVILYTVVDSLSLYSALHNWQTWLSSDKIRDSVHWILYLSTANMTIIRQGTCNSVHCSWFFISLQRTSQLVNMTIIRQGTCNSVHCSWFLYLSIAHFTTGEQNYHQTRYV